jgi:DNA-binding CsgD family transcriptional regulator
MPVTEHHPLVGREAEQRALREAVDAAAAGGPAVVAVFGEAGIGKSALLRSLAERSAAAGLRVLAARAAEHERDVPFALAVELLDDAADTIGPSRFASLTSERQAELAAVLPSLPTPAADGTAPVGAEERFRLHRALRALVELLARERPVALLLDDVHWADAASLELLLHLLRRPPRAPHLLAFALRGVDPAPRLHEALRTVAGAKVELTLGPIDRDAALALVAGVPDEAQRERIVTEAGGSPLFLHELARVGTADDGTLPPSILAAVRLEIAAQPPASRALLDGAAVAGDPFDPELAAAAADVSGGADWLVALDRLVAADLVRPGDGPRAFRFRHPLVRRAVYDAGPPAWRLGAHQRVAAVLAERGAAAVTRAYHVERCAKVGDREAVGVLGEAAAATAASSPADAARWYRAALALLPEDATDERIALLGPLAIALAAAGAIREAGAVLEEVLEALPPEPTPLRLMLVGAAAALDNLTGRHGAARARLLAALDELPPDVDAATRAALDVELSLCAVFEQDGEEARNWGLRALPGAASQPTLAATAHAVHAVGAIWTGRRHEVDAAIASALEQLDLAPAHEIALRPEAFFYVAFAQIFDERYQDAIATTRRGIEQSLAVGQGRTLASLRSIEAMGHYASGRYHEAAELAEAAEEGARLQGLDYALQFALWMRAGIAHDRGDAVERRRVADELEQVLARLPSSTSTRVGLANVASYLADEDPERCIRELLAVAGERFDLVEPTWVTALLQFLVRALVTLGRVDEADRYASLAEEQATRLALPLTTERARLCRAEVLLATGEAAAAADLAVEAMNGIVARVDGRDALEARLVAGRALAAAGRTDEAAAVLQAVVDAAGRNGGRRLRDAAARELRRAGVRPRGGAPAAAAGNGLTERERAIAELVVSGATNKQVGAALFLSEKTVETYLSRVYAKLGVKSRVQLTATWPPD